MKKRSFSNIGLSSVIINNNFNTLIPSKRKVYSNRLKKTLPHISIPPSVINKKNIKELIGKEFINNFNRRILINENWGKNIITGKNETADHEYKNVFRNPKKLRNIPNMKDIMVNRTRIPHIFNRIKSSEKI